MPKITISASGGNPSAVIAVEGTVRFFYTLFLVKSNGDLKQLKTGSNVTPSSLSFTITPGFIGESDWVAGTTAQWVWVSSFANPEDSLPADAKFSVEVTQNGKSILSGSIAGPVGGSNHLDLVIDVEVVA